MAIGSNSSTTRQQKFLSFNMGTFQKKKKRLQNGNEKLVLDEEPVSKTRYEANLSATAVEGIEPQTDIFT
jgi:hypothetical protein